jgi:ATP-dependent protease ClpP protease subunit
VSDIDVFVNSPGGNVWEGLAIANVLSKHPAQVHAHVDGLAASAASVITSAADMVTMGKGAMMMIHSPWSLTAGNA